LRACESVFAPSPRPFFSPVGSFLLSSSCEEKKMDNERDVNRAIRLRRYYQAVHIIAHIKKKICSRLGVERVS
jgi:hypothetical protein